MYRDLDYPKWAKDENMERSRPLCELWRYSDEPKKTVRRSYRVRRKAAKMLYKLADSIYAKPEWGSTLETVRQK